MLTKLPDGWVVKKLGNIVEVNKSSINKADNFNFINYLDTGNLTEGKIQDVQKLIIGQDRIPSRCKRKVSAGDILYSTVRPNQKHYGYLANILENMVVSTGFCVVSTKISEAHDKFIYYYLTQEHITEQLHAIAEQSKATYPSINPSDLTNLDIVLSPLLTQKRIASILSVIDEKIDINNQINNKLEEIAQALFKQWIIDFNFPDENGTPYKDSGGAMIDSELGKIPEGWQIVSLGQFIKFIKGKKPNLQSNKQFQSSSLYLTIDVLQGSASIFCDSVKMITSDERNILMVMDGASSGDVYRGVNGVVASTLAKIEVSNSIYLGLVYLYLKYFMIEIKSQNYGAAIPHLDKNYVLNMKLALPADLSIIKMFSQIDEEITKLIHTNTKEITALINIRDSLLPKLMSGEIDVTYGV